MLMIFFASFFAIALWMSCSILFGLKSIESSRLILRSKYLGYSSSSRTLVWDLNSCCLMALPKRPYIDKWREH